MSAVLLAVIAAVAFATILAVVAGLIAAMHADYARLLDALEAVLERHAPDPMEDDGISLVHCAVCTSFTGQAPWPCPDARAALTVLGVEGC